MAWGGESCVSQRGVVADRGRSTRTKRCNEGGTVCRARVAKAKVCRVYKATNQRQSASSSLLDAPGISREQKWESWYVSDTTKGNDCRPLSEKPATETTGSNSDQKDTFTRSRRAVNDFYIELVLYRDVAFQKIDRNLFVLPRIVRSIRRFAHSDLVAIESDPASGDSLKIPVIATQPASFSLETRNRPYDPFTTGLSIRFRFHSRSSRLCDPVFDQILTFRCGFLGLHDSDRPVGFVHVGRGEDVWESRSFGGR